MNKIFFLLVTATLCLYSCYDIVNNYDLSVKNNTQKNISILYSNIEPIDNENNVAYYIDAENIIAPDSILIITKSGGKNAWHDYIKEGNTNRLCLYVFEADTLKKYADYTINELAQQHKYFKQLHYSEKDMIGTAWKVTVN